MATDPKCVAIIMAGGSGERFWPLSRKLQPKQFLKLSSRDRSMLQEAMDRIAAVCGAENVVIATTPWLVDSTRALMGPDVTIYAEPHKRNTAGCLLWAAAKMLADGVDPKETSWAVVAADHRITPTEGFVRTVRRALQIAQDSGDLVTIGIRPTRPETGYGYIECGEGIDGAPKAFNVRTFHEKPDRARADQYVQNDRFLWNSGMFFWTFSGFLDALQAHAVDLYEAILSITAALKEGDQALAEKLFEGIRNVSIDYALMEKAAHVAVVEADFAWDDLGAWDALPRSLGTDEVGNVVSGEAIVLQAANNILWNDDPDSTLCVLGVDGLVVVQTPDATLICPVERAQEIRLVVEAMQKTRPEKV